MRVISKLSSDDDVIGGPPFNNYINYYLQRGMNKITRKLYKSDNPNYFSTAIHGTGMAKELNNLYFKKQIDILNLHWLGDNTISIREIGFLKMPLVWRLADEWAFCGCEQYSGIY